jgi:hypothetical protein
MIGYKLKTDIRIPIGTQFFFSWRRPNLLWAPSTVGTMGTRDRTARIVDPATSS